jgi:hypothetical protein
MSKTIYCGCKEKPPKNSVFGSMKECAEKGQIRRYGVKKIDRLLIDHMENAKKKTINVKKEKELLLDKIVKVTTKLKKLQNNIKSLKTKSEVMETKTEMDELEKERKSLLRKYEKEYSPKKEKVKKVSSPEYGFNSSKHDKLNPPKKDGWTFHSSFDSSKK